MQRTGAGAATGARDPAQLERELAESRRLLSLKDSQLKALQDRVKQLEGGSPPVPPAERRRPKLNRSSIPRETA